MFPSCTLYLSENQHRSTDTESAIPTTANSGDSLVTSTLTNRCTK